MTGQGTAILTCHINFFKRHQAGDSCGGVGGISSCAVDEVIHLGFELADALQYVIQ